MPIPTYQRILSSERQDDASADIPELADFQRSFVVSGNGEEDAPYEHIPAVIPPMTSYNLFDGVMAQSIAMISSERSRELWLQRTIVPPLSDLQINKPAQEQRREEELRKLGEVEVKVLGDRHRKCRRKSPGREPARLTRQSRVQLHLLQESSSSSEPGATEEEDECEDGGGSSDVDWQVKQKQKRKPVIRLISRYLVNICIFISRGT